MAQKLQNSPTIRANRWGVAVTKSIPRENALKKKEAKVPSQQKSSVLQERQSFLAQPGLGLVAPCTTHSTVLSAQKTTRGSTGYFFRQLCRKSRRCWSFLTKGTLVSPSFRRASVRSPSPKKRRAKKACPVLACDELENGRGRGILCTAPFVCDAVYTTTKSRQQVQEHCKRNIRQDGLVSLVVLLCAVLSQQKSMCTRDFAK